MTTQLHQPSAQIFAFPAGGRTSRGGQRPGAKSLARPTAARFSTVYGSGWYHEAAVKEAERSAEAEKPVRQFTDRV
jgi:hypothetical protein